LVESDEILLGGMHLCTPLRPVSHFLTFKINYAESVRLVSHFLTFKINYAESVVYSYAVRGFAGIYTVIVLNKS